MRDTIEKMKEIFENETLLKEMFSNEKPEDAQNWLSEHGVELSLDQIKALGDILKKVASGEITKEQLESAANGELSEDDLEEVSGGYSALEWGVALGFTGVAMAPLAVIFAATCMW
ncbi:hypothetical protein [Butyrivibrio sp.]|jgi:hypothetical protein|uniref:hypothetical protein n=1 Tax=Butyrivibrio sp. TaxID=28121 RepID=UPI0025BD1561|nr:hypothetical protein [Butyrivibrio sp.]MBE5837541.1 hypothetical protein [Butyrivibrio sp.]MBE5843191.1 hypothetical protein [Butyrivibrio sp.]